MVSRRAKKKGATEYRPRPWFPRQTWAIKPFDRVHESGKCYNRQRVKQEVRREFAAYLREVERQR